MRQRITNLVDELHWQLARWLTSNYRIILLPTFETQDMTQRAGRRIRSKTARMMLTFRHYEFKRRLAVESLAARRVGARRQRGVHQQAPQLGRYREHQVGRRQGNSG